jgi:hypothetical protein
MLCETLGVGNRQLKTKTPKLKIQGPLKIATHFSFHHARGYFMLKFDH